MQSLSRRRQGCSREVPVTMVSGHQAATSLCSVLELGVGRSGRSGEEWGLKWSPGRAARAGAFLAGELWHCHPTLQPEPPTAARHGTGDGRQQRGSCLSYGK